MTLSQNGTQKWRQVPVFIYIWDQPVDADYRKEDFMVKPREWSRFQIVVCLGEILSFLFSTSRT